MHQTEEPDNTIDPLELLETARRAGRLLKSQGDALRRGDHEKLLALSHQIGLCMPALHRDPGQLDEPLRGRLKREFHELRTRIDHNRSQWQRHLDSLRISRDRLNDSRRLTRSLKAQLQPTLRARYDRSA